MKKIIILAVAVVAAGAVATTYVLGQDSIPSSKAAVALGTLNMLPASTTSSDTTGWQTVMSTLIKTPSQKDLEADVALQCGLVTDTTVKSKGGNTDTAASNADIRVRVRATNVNNPSEVLYFSPNEGGNSENGVRYCDRTQQLSAKFSGLNCTADLTTGAVTCQDPEELDLLLSTLNANSFNFVLADVDSGVWRIDVQANAEAGVTLSGTKLGSGQATAFVGLGSTVVDTVRLVKGTDLVPITELP